MRQFSSHDGNLVGHIVGQSLNSREQQYPYSIRTLQMHSSLVQRLTLENVMEVLMDNRMEFKNQLKLRSRSGLVPDLSKYSNILGFQESKGHYERVNSLAWNAEGSLLMSGSDDTMVKIWSYGSRELLHSFDSGHHGFVYCAKFVPESGDDDVVSCAGDGEVRVNRVSISPAIASDEEPTALFRCSCHMKRIKRLAVEVGNPHVVWSAGKDGTFRQHDFREGSGCLPDQGCRNILVDLRHGQKKSLSDSPRLRLILRSCALSPTQPYLVLIGGSDSFARMYDRRMLPAPTSLKQIRRPPSCVKYFCPAHLSDEKQSGYQLTHVTFSPNGQEILLSYSGEHVYLMDINMGSEDPAVYAASDLHKRTSITPIVNDRSSAKAPSEGIVGCGRRRNSAWLQECRDLLEEARRALVEGGYMYAIDATGEVLDAGGQVVGGRLRHDCLCVRAAALLKRQWKNDIYMALRDANDACHIDKQSNEAHHLMAEALSQHGRHKEALDFAVKSYPGLLEYVGQLHAKIAGVGDFTDWEARMMLPPGSGQTKEEVAVDMRQRYVGYCNLRTTIKEASFLGERGEFVASGSEDGHILIWLKRTGRLIKMLTDDQAVVNCVQSHPFDCAIATSAYNAPWIKLWTPSARLPSMEAAPDTVNLLQVVASNEDLMRSFEERLAENRMETRRQETALDLLECSLLLSSSNYPS